VKTFISLPCEIISKSLFLVFMVDLK